MTGIDPADDSSCPDRPDVPAQPSDILLELIVGFLAPLFMAGCAGDIGFARLAAIETLTSYRARTQSELVKIAQIIAFGVAAMDNLRLSMAPGLSLSMIARLRAGANALNRSAQQNARALENSRRDNPLPDSRIATPAPDLMPDLMFDDTITETDIQASIERARAMVHAARDPMHGAATRPVPPAPQPPATPRPDAHPDGALCNSPPGLHPVPAAAPAPDTAEQRHRLMWADAMTTVAGELSANLAANLASVPPARRGTDRMWASALSSTASSLAMAAGSVPPGSNIGVERIDKRAKPD